MGKGSSIFSLSTARRRLSVAGPASRARPSPWLAPPPASSTSSSSLTGTASTPPHPCLEAPRPRRLCHRLLVPAGAGLPRPSLSRSLASFSRASLPHQLRRLQQSCRQGICGSIFHCRDFSSKAKKKTKSDGTDSGEENLSKKDLALHQAIDQIQSSFGKGAIMWLGRSQGQREVPVVSTGSFSLDLALGIGGFPKGRVIEVFGPEASGKTTLALHVIAEAQKSGGYCAFVDAEHALDPSLAESIGVNTRNLLLSQPDSGEQALSLVDTLIRSGSVDVVVVDSVAALVPKNELDGEMGDAHVALQARLMSQALRKLSHSLSLSQTILLFINQIRCKVSTFGGFGGPTEVTSGGNALKFYASVRLNIRRIGSVKKGEEIIGNQVAVKIVKNKHAPPFKTAHFELEFGKGICRSSELVELGLKHKLVKKCGGAMYSFNDMPFRGKDALKSYLTENESVAKELEKNLRTLIETEAPGKPVAEDTFPSESDLPEEIVTTETSSEEELTAGIEA